MIKKALVLAGGGTKGAYEAGAIQAFKEIKITFDIVTGTSVGALNACLVCQKDEEKLKKLWMNLTLEQVIGGNLPKDFHMDTLIDQSHLILPFFKSYIHDKGVDIAPLKRLMREMLDEKKLFDSQIDFGLCTVMYPSLKPIFLTKKEMKKEYIYDYLIASAACFPLFPMHKILQQSYIDGGYYDNLPIDLAMDMGAKEIYVIDLSNEPTYPYYLYRPFVHYILPYHDLGGFMDFSKERLLLNYRLGYFQVKKYFNQLKGIKYAFIPFQISLTEKYYQELLFLERNTRKILHSQRVSLFFDIFDKKYPYMRFQEDDYFYAVLEWIMELFNQDLKNVYCWDDILRLLRRNFFQYEARQYALLFHDNETRKIEILKKMSKTDIVGYIYHEFLYPHLQSVHKELFVTFFSQEILMAKLLFICLKMYK